MGESLWVTFPAACGVSPSHDQRRRQEAGLGLPEATREPPIGSLLKYPAACGGDPLFGPDLRTPIWARGMERAAAEAEHMSAPDHGPHRSRRFLLLLKGRPHMSQALA